MQNWSDQFLDSKRIVADPLADAVIGELLAQGSISAANDYFGKLIRNDVDLSSKAPPVLIDYFKQTAPLPAWANPERIRRGQDLFALYGPEFVGFLFTKSLPECYSCAKGAQVLYRTGRLREKDGNLDGLNRRIMETAQFVLDAMGDRGFSPHGSSVISTQKIRLIHAAIRAFIKKDGWDESLGEPINQEDLAGTLMSFSIELLDGIKMIGVQISASDEEDYLHAWKVIGHILGLDADLLPEDTASARQLVRRILDRQTQASPEGAALARSLIDYMDSMLPGNLFDAVPEFMMRHFCGERVADALSLRAQGTAFEDEVFGLAERVLDSATTLERGGLVARLARELNRAVLHGLVYSHNGYKQARFRIPESLRGTLAPGPKRRTLLGPIFGYRFVLEKS